MKSNALTYAAIGTMVVFFCLAPSSGLAGDDLADSAMADTESPDALETGTEDPDDLSAGTESPDDLVAGTEDPDALVTGTENPDARVAGTEQVDVLKGDTAALQDLPDADAEALKVERATLDETRERYEREALGAQDSKETATGSEPAAPSASSAGVDMQISAIHEAKQDLLRAREAAALADDAYGTMMARDYPRGGARLRIVDQRNVAHQALQAAQQRYEAALGGNAAPAN